MHRDSQRGTGLRASARRWVLLRSTHSTDTVSTSADLAMHAQKTHFWKPLDPLKSLKIPAKERPSTPFPHEPDCAA